MTFMSAMKSRTFGSVDEEWECLCSYKEGKGTTCLTVKPSLRSLVAYYFQSNSKIYSCNYHFPALFRTSTLPRLERDDSLLPADISETTIRLGMVECSTISPGG